MKMRIDKKVQRGWTKKSMGVDKKVHPKTHLLNKRKKTIKKKKINLFLRKNTSTTMPLLNAGMKLTQHCQMSKC